MNFGNYKNIINSLIEKAKTNAVKPLAEKVLGFISMIESIIFPLPVDPFLAALTLAVPRKAFRFALTPLVFLYQNRMEMYHEFLSLYCPNNTSVHF